VGRNCANVRLARVDLDRMDVSLEDITLLGIRFLGGRGINHYLLMRESSRETKPFDRRNPAIFRGGLLWAILVNVACEPHYENIPSSSVTAPHQ